MLWHVNCIILCYIMLYSILLRYAMLYIYMLCITIQIYYIMLYIVIVPQADFICRDSGSFGKEPLVIPHPVRGGYRIDFVARRGTW